MRPADERRIAKEKVKREIAFGPVSAHTHTVTSFSSPLYILAAGLWTNMRMSQVKIRQMSLLGVGVSLAGLAVAASLEKFLDDL
ncbi:hypothetical protein MRX96_055977 [Rhipicephalus microplus]